MKKIKIYSNKRDVKQLERIIGSWINGTKGRFLYDLTNKRLNKRRRKGQHVKRKKRGAEKEEKNEALNYKQAEKCFGLKKGFGLN